MTSVSVSVAPVAGSVPPNEVFAPLVADGTDQTAALNALLADPAASVVRLPAGEFCFASNIYVPPGKTLVGAGQDQTILKVLPTFDFAAGNSALLVDDGSTLASLTLDVDKVNNGGPRESRICGVIGLGQDFLVHDVTSKNATGYAFWGNGIDENTPASGTFLDCTAVNSQILFETTYADGVTFRNCVGLDGDGDIGIQSAFHPIAASNNITFVDCSYSGYATGIEVYANLAPQTNIVFDGVSVATHGPVLGAIIWGDQNHVLIRNSSISSTLNDAIDIYNADVTIESSSFESGRVAVALFSGTATATDSHAAAFATPDFTGATFALLGGPISWSGGSLSATGSVDSAAFRGAISVDQNTAITVGDFFVAAADIPTSLPVAANDHAASSASASIVAIDGSPVHPGGSVTLASGAIVTLTPASGLVYDPDHSFDALPAAAAGVAGLATDHFVYTLDNGTEAGVAIVVRGVDDAPEIDPYDDPVADPIPFAQRSAPVALAGAAVVTDVDSETFAGGSLVASLGAGAGAADRLVILTTASIALSGDIVMVGGVAIGSWTGGSNGIPLEVAFDSEADVDRVQALLRAIAFTNDAEDSALGQRTADIVLDDGGGDGGIARFAAVVSVMDPHDQVGSERGDGLMGTELHDTLAGLGGADYLAGNDGDDLLYGGAGDDFMLGGAGVDQLFGDDGADTLQGGDGADYLAGNAGIDILYGGLGDDFLLGGLGADRLFGEDGNDTLQGEEDNDYLAGNAGNDVLYGGAGDDFLLGGLGDDRLFGEDDNDTLQGEGGNDYLAGNAGMDILYGGTGDDFLLGGLGDDRLFGEDGADTLQGEDGNDYLAGNAGNDILYGGAGNDFLLGGLGDDRLFGEDGNDTLQGEGGNDYLAGNVGNDILYGGEGHDFLLGGAGDDQLFGESGNDTLQGEDGGDTLWGAGGNDILYGGAANDHLSGGSDNDLLFGEDGNDTLSGDDGSDSLSGGPGNDTLFGGVGDDLLAGDAGDDRLDGGDGNDVLIGGLGQDVLFGGEGADRFVFLSAADSLPAAPDRVTDFLAGTDHLDFSAFDANPLTAARDALQFIGTAAFDGALGELRWTADGDDVHVEMDLNGDKVADFVLILSGHQALTQADVVL